MPRKLTGRAPGRPKVKRREDGSPDPTDNKLSPPALRALAVELYFLKRQTNGMAAVNRAILDGSWPVARNAQAVATRASTTVQAVRKWRKSELFRVQLFSCLLTEARHTSRAKDAHRSNIQDSQDGLKLIEFLRAHWPVTEGFFSPINGRAYKSPETFARHLKANNCIPEAWVSEDNKSLSKPRV